ncbi:MAG: hypothetical protein ABL925_20605 [Methylococcales bacterium]
MSQQNSSSSRAANFRCISIRDSGQGALVLEDLLEAIRNRSGSKGFHAFYTHAAIVDQAERHEGLSASELRRCFENKGFNFKDDNQQAVGAMMLLGRHQDAHNLNALFSVLDGVRIALTETNTYFDNPGASINSCIVFGLHNRDPSFGSRNIPNTDFHEYLLWDDGGLWTGADSDWSQAASKDYLAWLGAGWMRSRLQNQLAAQHQQHCEFIPQIAEWAESARKNLLRSDEALVNFFKGEEPAGRQPWNSYIRTLCDFLPYHRPRDNSNDWYPSNSLADEGGPMQWHGFVDSKMHLHVRNLLLDGWLTLWPSKHDTEHLYLQPGSLALLFWAARWGDMPHTDSPEDFLANYNWAENKHWFGGNWPG